MSCLRLMGTWWLMTTVHHDHDITWPYDQDMTITTRILPTQHLWWSTKISWIHSSLQRLRIFKFMNIWPEMHWGWRWFEIFTNGRVPTIFMAPGCAGWVVWTPREWGWVIESYQAPSRLLLSCPAHCSTAATLTSTLQTLYYEETSERFIVTKKYWDCINWGWGFALQCNVIVGKTHCNFRQQRNMWWQKNV